MYELFPLLFAGKQLLLNQLLLLTLIFRGSACQAQSLPHLHSLLGGSLLVPLM